MKKHLDIRKFIAPRMKGQGLVNVALCTGIRTIGTVSNALGEKLSKHIFQAGSVIFETFFLERKQK